MSQVCPIRNVNISDRIADRRSDSSRTLVRLSSRLVLPLFPSNLPTSIAIAGVEAVALALLNARATVNAVNGRTPMTIRTQLKAGKLAANHNEGLHVRSAVKAGGIRINHNEALKVRSTVKAGNPSTIGSNHNEALKVRSTVKAGGVNLGNHNETLKVQSGVKAGGVGSVSNHNDSL